MKRFRSITVITLAAIALLVTANIVYLYGLYNSIKEQSIQMATESLRRADILDIISRMKGTPLGRDDSFVRLTLMIQGEQTADGSYEYPNLLDNIDKTMSEYFHFIASSAPDMKPRDCADLERIYRKELLSIGLNPKDVTIFDGPDTSHECDNRWTITVNNREGKPLITGCISPLSGYIFNRMAGIIVTSAAILILMSFLIWYLLHWVGKLRSIEQMKDDFTHNMTHELKTPVAVAYSAADSMLRYYDHSDETRNKKLLTIIMQRLNFLSGMIENILSMSMERFKMMQLNIERVKIRPIAQEVAGMIEMKADKHVKITVDIDDDAEVLTDPLHFGNVISNLLDNAVKYSGESVDINIIGDERGLSVTDSGIGMAKANIPYIFDKFYRVTDGDRYEVGGYGLGLYYVKQILDMQGWSIAVSSEENAGTTFTIKFSDHEKR